jgi:hypothetical protein
MKFRASYITVFVVALGAGAAWSIFRSAPGPVAPAPVPDPTPAETPEAVREPEPDVRSMLPGRNPDPAKKAAPPVLAPVKKAPRPTDPKLAEAERRRIAMQRYWKMPQPNLSGRSSSSAANRIRGDATA